MQKVRVHLRSNLCIDSIDISAVHCCCIYIFFIAYSDDTILKTICFVMVWPFLRFFIVTPWYCIKELGWNHSIVYMCARQTCVYGADVWVTKLPLVKQQKEHFRTIQSNRIKKRNEQICFGLTLRKNLIKCLNVWGERMNNF